MTYHENAIFRHREDRDIIPGSGTGDGVSSLSNPVSSAPKMNLEQSLKKPVPLRLLAIPNTRQEGRFAEYSPGSDPDPEREYAILWRGGVRKILYDLNPFPLNPLAGMPVFYAGLDLARALRILLFERQADIVMCIFENTAFFLVLLRALFRFKPRILLLEVSARGWKPRDIILDFVVPRVDHIIALTEHSRAYVESSYRVKAPVEVLGPGIDESFFKPVPRETEACILAVGDDISRDFATLLDAVGSLPCSVILKTRRPVEVPQEMRGRVRIIRERLSYAQLRDLYAAARLVCLPLTRTDNPGGISSLLEAMAMGKPVIASDHGTTRDHVVDGEHGLIVPPGDPKALESAIRRILGDPEWGEAMGARARARIEADMSMSVRGRKLARLLRRLAGKPNWPETDQA